MSERDRQTANRMKIWADRHNRAPVLDEVEPVEDDPKLLAALMSSIAKASARRTD